MSVDAENTAVTAKPPGGISHGIVFAGACAVFLSFT